MTPEESARLPPPGPDRERALALAIAGKEAASKAIGTGWSRGVRWRDVEVDLGPPPSVLLKGRAAELARSLGSGPRTRTSLEIRGPLALGQVQLLS
jgi:phosphopantetheinyl transferase (holo-ACP synthase)